MVIKTGSLEEALKLLESNEEFIAKDYNVNLAKKADLDETILEFPTLPKKVQDNILSMSSHSFWELEFILKCIKHYENKEHFKTSEELLDSIKYSCEKIVNYVYDLPPPVSQKYK